MAGGDTGRFPALHCNTRVDGDAIDPQKFLRAGPKGSALDSRIAGPPPPKKSTATWNFCRGSAFQRVTPARMAQAAGADHLSMSPGLGALPTTRHLEGRGEGHLTHG